MSTVVTRDVSRGSGPGRTVVLLLGAVVVIALVVALALATRRPVTGVRAPYDPRSVQPNGTQAITRLLADRGVGTRFGGSGDPSSTVVALPAQLGPTQLRGLVAAGARVVLLGDTSSVSPDGAGLRTVTRVVRTRDPGCDLPEAVNAGRARAGGVGFVAPERPDPAVPPIVRSCYDGALVTLDGGQVVALGSGEFLTNEHLAEDGDAALAIGLLGGRRDVVWYRSATPVAHRQGLLSLLPAGVDLAVVQLVIGVLALAAYQGRRLGPVVEEPLPVVVRGAETVEGRARLYRAAKARGRAASALRAGTRRRLAQRLGLGRTVAPAGLVTSVADRTGRPAAEVGGLLFGPPGAGAPESPDVVDDAGLVHLVDDLDALEREVRTA